MGLLVRYRLDGTKDSLKNLGSLGSSVTPLTANLAYSTDIINPFGGTGTLHAGAVRFSAEDTEKVLHKTTSISVWLYPPSGLTGTSTFFGNVNMTSPNNRKFSLFQYPDPYTLHYSWQADDSNSTYTGGTVPLVADTWNHVVAVQDEAKGYCKIYVNNQCLKNHKINIKDLLITFKNETYIATGAPYRYLSDLRIYDHALSKKEISNLYARLALKYDFNDIYLEPTVNLFPKELQNMYYGTTEPNNTSSAGNYKVITTAAGTYALSGWYRYNQDDTTTNSRITLAAHYTDGTSKNLSQYWSIIKDNKWHYFTLVGSTDSTKTLKDLYGWIFDHSKPGDNKKAEAKNIQLEFKDHSTIFITDKRESRQVIDASGWGHDGTFNNNSYAIIKDSPVGEYSIRVDGSNILSTDKIFNDSVNQCHTVSFWVKPTAAVADKQLARLVNFNNDYIIQSGYSRNRTLCYLNSGANDAYVYGDTLPLNEWTMVTWIVNTKTVENIVYYNGQFHAKSSNYTSADMLRGFKQITEFFRNFAGQIADIRIYASQLTPVQIKDLYSVGMSVTDTDEMIINSKFTLGNKPKINNIKNVESPMYSENIPGIDLMTLEDGSVWYKLLHHNNKGGTNLFTRETAGKCEMEGKISRLNTLNIKNNYVGRDGKYEFYLYYPTRDKNKYNRWKQSINPFNARANGKFVDGYEEIHIDYPGQNWCGLVGGNNNSLLVGSNNGNWYHACGCWNKFSTGIPDGVSSTAGVTELWVRIDNAPTLEKINSKAAIYSNNISAKLFIEN